MLFTPRELLDLVLMVVAIGFIFSRLVKRPKPITKNYDPLKELQTSSPIIEDLKWGIIVAAPAVVFHQSHVTLLARRISFECPALLLI